LVGTRGGGAVESQEQEDVFHLERWLGGGAQVVSKVSPDNWPSSQLTISRLSNTTPSFSSTKSNTLTSSWPSSKSGPERSEATEGKTVSLDEEKMRLGRLVCGRRRAVCEIRFPNHPGKAEREPRRENHQWPRSCTSSHRQRVDSLVKHPQSDRTDTVLSRSSFEGGSREVDETIVPPAPFEESRPRRRRITTVGRGRGSKLKSK
jgi:hypothetical protein